MKPTRQEIEILARQAGEILRAGYHQRKNITLKGEIDIVTETDRKAEEFILNAIGGKFPDHRIIAEESGGLPRTSEQVWYIDPIDGTTNFANQLPIFCVSIAYAEGADLKIGVVYNPISDEMYSAEKGQGAWMNGSRLQVSSATELNQSILVTGFPYDRFTNPDNNLENFAKFALKVRGIRRLGSAALDLCYVAAGRLDGYWEIRLEPWDLAAGTLIAKEAGALVTRRNGTEEMLAPPCSIVAANPVMHAKMLAVLHED